MKYQMIILWCMCVSGIYAGEKSVDKWPWEIDTAFRNQRIHAIERLRESGAEFQPEKGNWQVPVQTILFTFYFDEEMGDLKTAPDKVDAKLLMETFPFTPEVKRISFQMTRNLNDDGLESLIYLPCLEDLAIITPHSEQFPLKITDVGIAHAAHCPSLKILTFRGLNLTNSSIQIVGENVKNLKCLDISSPTLNDESFQSISLLKNLEILNVGLCPYGRDKKRVSACIFSFLKDVENLKILGFSDLDLSDMPSDTAVEGIHILQKKQKLLTISFCFRTKVHPKLLKELCEIKSLQNLLVFQSRFLFTPDHPICYERVMYELYKKNAVPEYYQKLEKEFEEELKWHTWADKKGRELKAKLVKIGKEKVSLEKEDGAEITISRTSLSQDDQLYLQELERLEEDKKNDAEKGK